MSPPGGLEIIPSPKLSPEYLLHLFDFLRNLKVQLDQIITLSQIMCNNQEVIVGYLDQGRRILKILADNAVDWEQNYITPDPKYSENLKNYILHFFKEFVTVNESNKKVDEAYPDLRADMDEVLSLMDYFRAPRLRAELDRMLETEDATVFERHRRMVQSAFETTHEKLLWVVQVSNVSSETIRGSDSIQIGKTLIENMIGVEIFHCLE